MAGGLFGRNETGGIVGPSDINVIYTGAAGVASGIAGKTGITDEWNEGAGAIGCFYWPPISGRIRVGYRRRDARIGQRANEVRDIRFTVYPQVVIHNHKTSAEVVCQVPIQIVNITQVVSQKTLGCCILSGGLVRPHRAKPHWHRQPVTGDSRGKTGADIPWVTTSAERIKRSTWQLVLEVGRIHRGHHTPLLEIRGAIDH